MELTLDQAKDFIKQFDHESIKVTSNSASHIIKVKISGDRKEFLEQLQIKFQESNFISEIIAKSRFSRLSGHLKISNIYIITKPVVGATEELGIYASELTKYGEKYFLDIFGHKQVECSTFNNHSEIISSIMRSFEENKQVSPDIIKVFDNFFQNITNNPHEFNWSDKIKKSEKNELGKYLGEVILGVIVAADGVNSICLDGNFIQDVSDYQQLIYPVSSNFKNIDSIIKSSQYIPISNKMGVGASASIFSNILPFIKNPKGIVLNRLMKSVAYSVNLPRLDQNVGIIYHYGLNYITKMDHKNPIQIYYDLKGKKETPEILKIVEVIRQIVLKNTSNFTEKLLQYLSREKYYSGITGFFCREIAKELNSDLKSIQEMEKIVSDKDFYQANLNYSDWMNGKIKYSIKKSDNLNLVIMGNKSSYADLLCSGGKLTYELRIK